MRLKIMPPEHVTTQTYINAPDVSKARPATNNFHLHRSGKTSYVWVV